MDALAEKTVTRRVMTSEPIVVPENPEGSKPFLLGFLEKPNGGEIPAFAGNSTYLGTTPDPRGGESGDFKNDDD